MHQLHIVSLLPRYCASTPPSSLLANSPQPQQVQLHGATMHDCGCSPHAHRKVAPMESTNAVKQSHPAKQLPASPPALQCFVEMTAQTLALGCFLGTPVSAHRLTLVLPAGLGGSHSPTLGVLDVLIFHFTFRLWRSP